MALRSFGPSELTGAYELAGHAQFRYLQPFMIEAFRYACYTTLLEVGPCKRPMYVYDCAMSNGQTPTGRHPGGAHNGGINSDIGYYMNTASGGPEIGPHNGRQLIGKPTRLDNLHQARWFAALAELDLALQGKMIRLCACDPRAEPTIDASILQLLNLSSTVENRAVQIAYSSTGGGWGTFHHHHVHARFNNIGSEAVTKWIRSKVEAVLARRPGKPPEPVQPDEPNIPVKEDPSPEPSPVLTRQPDDDGQGERITMSPTDPWPQLGTQDTLVLRDGFYGPVTFQNLPTGIVVRAEHPGQAVIDGSHYNGYAITIQDCAGLKLIDLAVADTERKIQTIGNNQLEIIGSIKTVKSITAELDPHVD